VSEHDDRLVRRVVEAGTGRDAAEACPDPDVLGLYAERGLEADEQAGVDTHLAGCTRCQATVAAFVRSAPDNAPAGAGAGATGASWWAGWRWLVPVTAAAAVAIVAVWLQRPAVTPDVRQAESSAPPAATTSQAEPGRSESPAATSPSSRPPTAAAPADAAAGTGAAGRRGAAAAESSALADAAGPSGAPHAARSQAAQTAAFGKAEPFARADATAATAATAMAAPNAPPAAALAAPSSEERVADARERSAQAPAPAPPAVGALQETMTVTQPAETQALARRRSDRLDANHADGAASPQAKAVAGGGSARALGVAGARAVAKQPAQLTGRVTYRTRAALPEGAVVDVRLLDVSRMDTPTTVLGRVEIVTRGEQVPVAFTVDYDAAAIDSRRRYTVQATITIAGQIAYRTTTAHLVLTDGAPAAGVEVVVEPMR
jgi:uncharacterized lipoprotein YbaY